MGALLQSVLLAAAAAVLVSDRGLVYEPALSPDGTQLLWASVDESGEVSLQLRPVEGEQPPRVIAVLGEGAEARRLAMQTLIEGPWSPDGAWIAVLAPGLEPGTVRLELVRPDGEERRAVGPAGGRILAAGWIADDALVLAHQGAESAGAQLLRVSTDPQQSAQRIEFDLPEGARILDLAAAPGGEWVALTALVGKPTERVRALFVLHLSDARSQRLGPDELAGRANMLRWARTPEGVRLYLISTSSHRLAMWKPGAQALEPVADRVETAQPVADGQWVVARSSDDTLEAIFVGTDVRNRVGSGVVATSAAGPRLALVRTAEPGAAVLVTEASEEGLLAGDIGAPDLLAPEPEQPEQPTPGLEQPPGEQAPVVAAQNPETGEPAGEETQQPGAVAGASEGAATQAEEAAAGAGEQAASAAGAAAQPVETEAGASVAHAQALRPEEEAALERARAQAQRAAEQPPLSEKEIAEQEAIEEARRLAEQAQAQQPIAGFERNPEGHFSLEEVIAAEPDRRRRLVGQSVTAEGRVVRLRRPLLGGRKPLLKVRLGDGTLVSVEPLDWSSLAAFERGDRVQIVGLLGNEDGTVIINADVRRIGARSVFELLPEGPNERRRERR